MDPLSPDPNQATSSTGGFRRWIPLLTLTAALAGLGGIAITILLPSQTLKPDALRAQALIERDYREMIDGGTRDFPKESTAYIAREACWTEGKSLCIYGWYAEWKGTVYLMSFTYAAEAEDRKGYLRGWWWEVDVQKEAVRPLWRSAELREKYRLQETEEFRRLAEAGGFRPDRPTVAPLLKVP